MSSSRTLEEAMTLMDQGTKFTKTSLFRWSPDYHKAADCFSSAAKKFQSLGKPQLLNQAKANEKAGQCFEELNSLNTSAKHFSQALSAYTKLSSSQFSQRAIQCGIRAKDLYMANGQIGMGASILDKVAKLLDGEGEAEEAMKQYRDAVYLFLDNDKKGLSHDMFKTAIGYAIRKEMKREAVKLLKKQNEVLLEDQKVLRMSKNCLAIVVVLLSMNEEREAADLLLTFPSEFIGTEEYDLANDLITAFEEQDGEKLATVKSRPTLRLIETQVARLVKGLEVGGDTPFLLRACKGKGYVDEGGNSNGNGNMDGDDDDDFEVDLT